MNDAVRAEKPRTGEVAPQTDRPEREAKGEAKEQARLDLRYREHQVLRAERLVFHQLGDGSLRGSKSPARRSPRACAAENRDQDHRRGQRSEDERGRRRSSAPCELDKYHRHTIPNVSSGSSGNRKVRDRGSRQSSRPCARREYFDGSVSDGIAEELLHQRVQSALRRHPRHGAASGTNAHLAAASPHRTVAHLLEALYRRGPPAAHRARIRERRRDRVRSGSAARSCPGVPANGSPGVDHSDCPSVRLWPCSVATGCASGTNDVRGARIGELLELPRDRVNPTCSLPSQLASSIRCDDSRASASSTVILMKWIVHRSPVFDSAVRRHPDVLDCPAFSVRHRRRGSRLGRREW